MLNVMNEWSQIERYYARTTWEFRIWNRQPLSFVI